MMTCSYCTLVRMKIVVYLLPCNFLGSTVIKQRAPAQPSTSHLLILTSLQPYCVGLLSEHTCLAQPAPIKPFKVKTKGCVVVRKKAAFGFQRNVWNKLASVSRMRLPSCVSELTHINITKTVHLSAHT